MEYEASHPGNMVNHPEEALPLRVWHNEHSAPLRLFLIFRNQIPVNTPEYHHDERSKYHDSASSTLCGRGY